jgi:hypothetical protein
VGWHEERASWQLADVESSEKQEALLAKCRAVMAAGSSPSMSCVTVSPAGSETRLTGQSAGPGTTRT